MLNIFEYYSYRKFLSDYVDYRKSSNAALGLRSFSLKVGISPGHLSQVIKGKKNLSKEHIGILTKAMKLNLEEQKFFNLLVSFDHEESESKEMYLRAINIERSKRLISKKEAHELNHALSWKHLFFLVLIGSGTTLVDLKSFSMKSLAISGEEFESIFECLLGLGIVSSQSGRIQKTDKRLVLSSEVDNRLLKSLHKDFLKENILRIDTISSASRYSVTEFVQIPEENLQRVKEITNCYLDEIASLIMSLDSKSVPKSVLGICLHLNEFKI